MSRPILEVSGLTMRFGGLLAVNNGALSVQPKQVVSMIGPNGAGKTTVFNCLTGFYQPTGGVILLDDYNWTPHINQKRAFDELAKEWNVPILGLPTGQGVIVKPPG